MVKRIKKEPVGVALTPLSPKNKMFIRPKLLFSLFLKEGHQEALKAPWLLGSQLESKAGTPSLVGPLTASPAQGGTYLVATLYVFSPIR